MEERKKKLVEAGIIGRVVDDFSPHIKLTVFYGNKRIRLGEELSLGDVERLPDHFDYSVDSDRSGLNDLWTKPNRKLITLIMTDPNAPGGEHLHWLATNFITPEHQAGKGGGIWSHIVPYDAPRSMSTRMIVFTLFIPKEPPKFVPWRQNFSTKGYAAANALGPPLGAAFFKLKDESKEGTPIDLRNEDKETQTDFKMEDKETQTDFKKDKQTQTDFKMEDKETQADFKKDKETQSDVN